MKKSIILALGVMIFSQLQAQTPEEHGEANPDKVVRVPVDAPLNDENLLNQLTQNEKEDVVIAIKLQNLFADEKGNFSVSRDINDLKLKGFCEIAKKPGFMKAFEALNKSHLELLKKFKELKSSLPGPGNIVKDSVLVGGLVGAASMYYFRIFLQDSLKTSLMHSAFWAVLAGAGTFKLQANNAKRFSKDLDLLYADLSSQIKKLRLIQSSLNKCKLLK